MNSTTFGLLHAKGTEEQLTLDELACALYEGTPHLQNLAEKLARQHGQARALCFYDMQSEEVKNLWRGIAAQLVAHSRECEPNNGSCCVLSIRERARLAALPKALDLAARGGK